MQQEDEKIGVVRIILHHPQCGFHAVLSGFLEANRQLAQWIHDNDGAAIVGFEIRYQDGRRVSGEYDPKRRGRGEPSLRAFLVRGKLVTSAFMSRYELADPPKVLRK